MAVLNAFLSEPEVTLRISGTAVTSVTRTTGGTLPNLTPATIKALCDAAVLPIPVLVFD